MRSTTPKPRFLTDPRLRFEFSLARELGMTHAELLERMSGQEFAHWAAYFRIEGRENEERMSEAKNQGQAARGGSPMRPRGA